jgi:adenylate cyclase
LRDEHQHVDLPPWVGAEVTGQAPYYNSALALHPFATWPRDKMHALGL